MKSRVGLILLALWGVTVSHAAVLFSFEQDLVEYNVGNGFAVLAVTRAEVAGEASVDYRTTDGSMTAGAGYSVVAGTLSFAEGDSRKVILVPVFTEASGTFNVVLENPSSGAALGMHSEIAVKAVDEYTTTIVDSSFRNAIDAVSADIDGDGDLDILGAGYWEDQISWWENSSGDGSAWEKHVVEDNFNTAHSVWASDMDGDGDLDVVGAASEADEISWWENADGRGETWAKRVVVLDFNGVESVCAVDLNGDGDQDILGAAFHDDEVCWWENNGAGEMGSRNTVAAGLDGVCDVYFEDIDGDGDYDIICAVSAADEVCWLENLNGDATVWNMHIIDVAFDAVKSVFLADLDGDGDLDALGSAYFSSDLRWWENTADDGTSWVKHVVDDAFPFAPSVHSADLDGDGDFDILAAASNADEIDWWENMAGNGLVWTKHVVAAGRDGAKAVQAADIDGDGDEDIIGAIQSADDIVWCEKTGIPLLNSYVDGSLAEGESCMFNFCLPLATGATNLTLLSNSGALSVPVSVPVAAGERTVSFSISASDDSLLNGSREEVFTIMFDGKTVPFSVLIEDDETSVLTIELPASADEGAGILANAGLVRASLPVDSDVTVQLQYSDTYKLRGPENVVIPAGADFVAFDLLVPNNRLFDGLQNITVSASVCNWGPGEGEIQIVDDDMVLELTLPEYLTEGSGPYTNAGVVSILYPAPSNITCSLQADLSAAVLVPSTVTIVEGATSASFDLTPVDNSLREGSRQVTVRATKEGWSSMPASCVLYDDEEGLFSFTQTLASYKPGVGFAVVKVNRTDASRADQINYLTVEGSLLEDVDFLNTTGTLFFAVGETEQPIFVPVISDTEGNFYVRLTGPSTYAGLGQNASIRVQLSASMEKFFLPERSRLNSIQPGDIDGDGDLDLFGFESGYGRVYWWENLSGSGRAWDNHMLSNYLSTLRSVNVVDMDGDGDLDIVGVNAYVFWLENTGGGDTSWIEHTIGLNSFYSNDAVVKAGDLDADGDLDVVFLSEALSELSWWDNRDGDGSKWEKFVLESDIIGASELLLEDMNGDGVADILVKTNYGKTLDWWERNDSNAVEWIKHPVMDTTSSQSFSVADIDGDGDIDLLCSAYYADEIYWFENVNSDGSLWTKNSVAVNFNYAKSATAADIDGDGDLDIVGSAYSLDELVWWENEQSKGTTWEQHILDDDFVGGGYIFTTDLDGDGHADIVGGESRNDCIVWWRNPGRYPENPFIPDALTEGESGTGWYCLQESASQLTKVYIQPLNTQRLAVPAVLSFDSGEQVISFNMMANDDELLNGSTELELEVSYSGDLSTANMTIHDNEQAVLSLELPAVITENSGILTNAGITRVSRAVSSDVLVQLKSSDLSELEVPENVTIRSGEDFATFDLIVPNDGRCDGTQNVTVQADVESWIPDSSTVAVHDEDLVLQLDIPEYVAEGWGQCPDIGVVSIPYAAPQQLVILLESSNTAQLKIAPVTVIQKGNTTANFYIEPMDDNAREGPETISVTATVQGGGWQGASAALVVQDNEDGLFGFDQDRVFYKPGCGFIEVTVYRNSSENAATVDYSLVDGELVSGMDYQAGSGTLQFAAGENEVTVLLPVFSDQSGSFSLVLEHPSDYVGLSQDEEILVTLSANMEEHIVDDTVTGADAVVSVDLDGDGDMDILGAANVDDELCWWENTSGDASVLSKHLISDDLDGIRSVFSSDLDGDGDLDILVAANDAHEISWWENIEGNGAAWNKHVIDSDLDGAREVYSVDMDADGDLDVIAIGSGYGAGYGVSWWENTEGIGQAWIEHAVDDNVNYCSSAHPIDIDGDGDIDILGKHGHEVCWWDNTEGNGLSWAKHTLGYSYGLHSVESADLDGDGDLDIIGAASSSPKISWWENNVAIATNWTKHIVEDLAYIGGKIHSTDLDRDGDNDILLGRDDDMMCWWQNLDGSGSHWQKTPLSARFADFTSVDSADLDGDGDIDVLGASFNSRKIIWWENPGDAPSNPDAPASVTEGESVSVRLCLPSLPESSTNITVSTVLPSRLSVPASVAVSAGQRVVAFDISATDDALSNGSTVEQYEISYGDEIIPASIIVHDNEAIALTLVMPASLEEGSGLLSAAGTINLSAPPTSDVLVELQSSDISELQIPPSILIPAGTVSFSFDLNVPDDMLFDGTQSVSVSAVVTNWDPGYSVIEVIDDDMVVTLDLPSSVAEGWDICDGIGTASIPIPAESELSFSLYSSNSDELRTPRVVNISEGSTFGKFSLKVEDDQLYDGPQSVEVGISSETWRCEPVAITVQDNEEGLFSFKQNEVTYLPGSGFAVLTVIRSSSTNEAAISYTTVDGSLLGGADFMAAAGTLDFAVGESEKTLLIPIITEAYGSFSVLLENPPVHSGLNKDYVATVTCSEMERIMVDDDLRVLTALSSADLDGDGDLDLVGVGDYSDCVYWWENTVGDGTEWVRHIVGQFAYGCLVAVAVAVADVDGDGDLDVLGQSDDYRIWDDQAVCWWENLEGDAQTWGNRSVSGSFYNANTLLAADIDSDGDLDILGGTASYYSSGWWENVAGTGGYWRKRDVDSAFQRVTSADAADLDGDGDIDLLGTYNDRLMWFENVTGDGSSWTNIVLDEGFDYVSAVTASDLDCDGDLDIICISFGAQGICWWENKLGDATSWIKQTIDIDSSGVSDVTAADMDSDGDPDLLAVDEDGQNVFWWDNNLDTDGIWGRRIVELDIEEFVATSVGDLDNDGDLDIIGTASSVNDIFWWKNPGTIAANPSVPSSLIEGEVGTASFFLPQPAAAETNLVLSTAGSLRLSLPAFVPIAVGQQLVTFEITAVDDALLNGSSKEQFVLSFGSQEVLPSIIIHDNEAVALTVKLPDSLVEGSGIHAGAGTISVQQNVSAKVTVTLESSDFTELQVPEQITIPAGSDSASFYVKILDDTLYDNTQRVTVTSTVTNWTAGDASMDVQDNDMFSWITLTEYVAEGWGNCPDVGMLHIPYQSTVDLTFDLSASSIVDLTIPASITIPAGELFARFDIEPVDDAIYDGVQTITVRALAEGWQEGSDQLVVQDNEDGLFSFESSRALYLPDVGYAVLSVIRSVATGDVSVNYSTVNDSLVEGTHYQATTGTLFFAAGETKQEIVVPVLSQSDGVFYIQLSDPSNHAGLSRSELADVRLSRLGRHDFITDTTVFDSLIAADMDGDGDQDLLGAKDYEKSISWWENQGDKNAIWSEHIIAENLSNVRPPCTVDIDGDGDLDIVSAGGSDTFLCWWENLTGNATSWAMHLIDGDFTYGRTLCVGDMDRDGNIDVISSKSSSVFWWKNPGKSGGTWFKRVVDEDCDLVEALHVADLNRDGDLDIIAIPVFSDDPIVYWDNAVGSGISWSERTVSEDFGNACSVTTADLDRDGDLDIVAANDWDDKISWWQNSGYGSFMSERVIISGFNGAGALHAVDIDGDGDTDILATASYDDEVCLFENSGYGSSWSKHIVDSSFNGAEMVLAADIFGDSALEIVGIARWEDTICWWTENTEAPANPYTPETLVEGESGVVRYCLPCAALAMTTLQVRTLEPGRLSAPESVFAASGQQLLDFDVSAVDDDLVNPDIDVVLSVRCGELYKTGSVYVVNNDSVGTADSDGDGIPDEWESLYFGTSGNCIAGGDQDGDRSGNWQEYIAGTNPTNASSFFMMKAFRKAEAGVAVDWDAVDGRIYSVYWSTNLLDGFQCLESGIPCTRSSFTNQTIDPCGFFFINVELE